MVQARKARAVGFNHVALEVDDIEEALAFYGHLFDFKLRGRAALRSSSISATNSSRCSRAERNLSTRDVILGLWSTTRMPSARRWLMPGSSRYPDRFSTFSTPWGNRIEIVSYDNVQFTKAPNVLRGMGLTHLSKNEKAIKELIGKGMAPN